MSAGIRKKKASRAVHHRNVPETWHERLDAAVTEAFKDRKVVCKTEFDTINMRWVTRWEHPNGNKLPPSLARRVAAFVAGFMKAEEWYL